MFWKKKKLETSPTDNQDNNIILGMLMLPGGNTFDIDNFTNELRVHHNYVIKDPAGDDSSFGFTLENESVVIAHMPVPIPEGDLEGTARYAYNWPTVIFDTREHRSHLIVTIIHGSADQIKRYKIFTQVVSTLLQTTDSIGVYQGGQSLLISKQQYLHTADLMDDDYLPLDLWIYIGLHQDDNCNSGYTYGLKQFGKSEMEIICSDQSLEDIRGMLFNMTSYVLNNNVTFRDGETCGVSQEERIKIKYSEGKFVEGKSFKFIY